MAKPQLKLVVSEKDPHPQDMVESVIPGVMVSVDIESQEDKKGRLYHEGAGAFGLVPLIVMLAFWIPLGWAIGKYIHWW